MAYHGPLIPEGGGETGGGSQYIVYASPVRYVPSCPVWYVGSRYSDTYDRHRLFSGDSRG